jgi:hypothetical protein
VVDDLAQLAAAEAAALTLQLADVDLAAIAATALATPGKSPLLSGQTVRHGA